MGRIPEVESLSVTKYGLGYIRPYHREFARRLVLGEKAKEICDALGVSESRFSIIVNSPLFKMEIKRLEEMRDRGVGDVTQTLRELSPIALEVVERTMHKAKSESMRFTAAESILDRAGFGKTSRTDVRVSGGIASSNLSQAELRKLVEERVKRMKDEIETRNREDKDAEAIEIEFEVCEESKPETKFVEPRNEVYPLE